MFIMQLLIALIPFGIIHYFVKKYDHPNNKKIFNLIFYMVVSLILLSIYDYLIIQISPTFYQIIPFLINPISFYITAFVTKLFTTGLPEEIAKYLAIKMSKPKDNEEIIKNSLYISTIFMFYENYSYACDGIVYGLWKSILPVHIISQIVMSYFLIKKGKEKEKRKSQLYSVLSLLIPIIIHTLYNCCIILPMNEILKALFILIFGIITYIIAAKYIKSGIEKNKESENENDIKISKIKWIIILLVTLFWLYIYRI